MKTEHTPTPWRVGGNIGRKSELGIIADKAPCIIATMSNAKAWPAEAKANAAHIVLCVNSHAQLVSALCAAIAEMDAANFHPKSAAAGTLHAIKAALAAAEGKQ